LGLQIDADAVLTDETSFWRTNGRSGHLLLWPANSSEGCNLTGQRLHLWLHHRLSWLDKVAEKIEQAVVVSSRLDRDRRSQSEGADTKREPNTTPTNRYSCSDPMAPGVNCRPGRVVHRDTHADRRSGSKMFTHGDAGTANLSHAASTGATKPTSRDNVCRTPEFRSKHQPDA